MKIGNNTKTTQVTSKEEGKTKTANSGLSTASKIALGALGLVTAGAVAAYVYSDKIIDYAASNEWLVDKLSNFEQLDLAYKLEFEKNRLALFKKFKTITCGNPEGGSLFGPKVIYEVRGKPIPPLTYDDVSCLEHRVFEENEISYLNSKINDLQRRMWSLGEYKVGSILHNMIYYTPLYEAMNINDVISHDDYPYYQAPDVNINNGLNLIFDYNNMGFIDKWQQRQEYISQLAQTIVKFPQWSHINVTSGIDGLRTRLYIW